MAMVQGAAVALSSAHSTHLASYSRDNSCCMRHVFMKVLNVFSPADSHPVESSSFFSLLEFFRRFRFV